MSRKFFHSIVQSVGSVQADTLLVIVNALSFKSDWEEAFDDEGVTKSFVTGDGQVLENVDMMTGEIKAGLADVDGTKIVSIPFKDQGFRMAFVLPSQESSKQEYLHIILSKEPRSTT